MEVRSQMRTHERLNKEIARLQKRVKELKAEKIKIENTLFNYLDEKGKDKIKNPETNYVFSRKEVTRRKPKNPSKKKEDCMDVLKRYGIKSEKVWDDIEEAMKGEKYTKVVGKI